MEHPKVSIILPVGPHCPPVEETLKALGSQTCREVEVLCAPYGGAVLAHAEDSRIHTLAMSPSAGAAANLALEQARGQYLAVLKAGDVPARDWAQRIFDRASQTQADVLVFCGYTRSRVGNPKNDEADGYDPKVGSEAMVYSRESHPRNYLSIAREELSFRLFRTAFLHEQDLRFLPVNQHWQMPFAALCDASAKSIALMDRRMLTTAPADTAIHGRDVLSAVDLVARELGCSPAVQRLLVEYTTAAFRRSTADFDSLEAKTLYDSIRALYTSPFFAQVDTANLTERDRCFYETISATDYDTMLARISLPLVVSFTSFPKRIDFTVNVIENVRRQTRKADKVLLYLAPEQFPGKEADLPEALRNQVSQGLVELRWVRDVRSHKKYHFVMQEFPESLIVTLDDDLAYPDDMLENLFHCYLCHPQQISAMRAHLTVIDRAAGEILSYNRWVKEYRGGTYLPSPQLFVTSGAGTLFPPGVLHPLALDLDKAWSLCPHADDVWLNMMTLLNGRNVVLAVDDFTMKNMPGSQEEALQNINVEGNQNDVQYNRIREFLCREQGRDVIWEALTAGDPAIRCRTVMDLSDQYLALEEERKRIQAKLHQVWRDKVAREQDLAKLRQELAEERRAFPFLRVLASLRKRGLKQTVQTAVNKVLRKFRR